MSNAGGLKQPVACIAFCKPLLLLPDDSRVDKYVGPLSGNHVVIDRKVDKQSPFPRSLIFNNSTDFERIGWPTRHGDVLNLRGAAWESEHNSCSLGQ